VRTSASAYPRSSRTHGKNFIQQALSARKGFLAYLPLILALGALLTVAMTEAYFGNLDVVEYQCYAKAFWFGAKPTQSVSAPACQFIPQISQYHTLPSEYPPLALIVFSLPLLVPGVGYPLMFALFMAATTALIYWLLLKYGVSGAANVFAVCLVAGCMGTGLSRFDMVPAGLCLLCIILAEHKRWGLAYAVLAVGVLIKIYPIVILPILFLAEQHQQAGSFFPYQSIRLKTAGSVLLQTFRNIRRWRWKNALMFSGLVLGVTIFFGALSSKGVFSWISYLFRRPFEVGSTGSSLLWLTSLAGVTVTWKTTYGSMNTFSPIEGTVAFIFGFLFWMGYIIILLRQSQGKLKLVEACIAALLVMIATSKVFSPQYLLWLIPLLAYRANGNRRLWLIWGAIFVLTSLIYPVYYGFLSIINDPARVPGFLPVILLRDGLLVLLTAAYLFNFLKLREPLPHSVSK
jgi:hypothetical protein